MDMNMEKPSVTPDAEPRKRIDREMKGPKDEMTPARYTYDPVTAFGPEGTKITQTVINGVWKPADDGVRRAPDKFDTSAYDAKVAFNKKLAAEKAATSGEANGTERK